MLYAVWEKLGPRVTITYNANISGVKVGGQSITSGWSGVIAPGTTIVASGSIGDSHWTYYGTGGDAGHGTTARCTVPSGASGTGSLSITGSSSKYYLGRSGVCASWTFTAS